MSFWRSALLASVLCIPALTGCGGGSATPGGQDGVAAPNRSHDAAAPMVVGPPLAPDVMTRGAQDHHVQMADQARAAAGARNVTTLALGWSYVPAAASQVVVAPDGSLWALATVPAGPDKSIWHYDGSRWVNVPGGASRLAVAADGSLWAITSLGGLYHYQGGAWSTIGGASQDLALDPFGTVYVVAKGSLADEPIWQYTAAGFRPAGGAGVRVFAQPDLSLYVITSNGAIYARPTGAAAYVQCPGAAIELAPLLGSGFFVLGYTPAAASGSPVYAFTESAPGDCRNGTYQLTNGFGTSISTNAGLLAVVGTDGAIYTARTSAGVPGS